MFRIMDLLRIGIDDLRGIYDAQRDARGQGEDTVKRSAIVVTSAIGAVLVLMVAFVIFLARTL